MNTLRKTGYVLGFLLFVVILSSAFITNDWDVACAAETCQGTIVDLCKQYTSNTMSKDIELDDYLTEYDTMAKQAKTVNLNFSFTANIGKGTLFGANVQYSGGANVVTAVVDADDNIVNFIPRDLFTYENKTFFIGEKYGFFIVTTNVKSDVLRSTVVFVEVNGDVGDYLADVKLVVRNSIDFVCVKRAGVSYEIQNANNEHGSGCVSICNLNGGANSAVIPAVCIFEDANGKKVGFYETERYTLANISFAGQIRNHNTLNPEDVQYNASEDNGYFFIGNNYYYSASKYSSKGFSDGITQFATDMVSQNKCF